MKILVVGNGGREHALAWHVARSPRVSEVLVAPGNAGTAQEPKCRNVEVPADDLVGLVALARDEHIHLTIVGPEVPLAAGLRDRFDAAGLRCFGPTQAAARLESSKAFAKDFFARHGIPTARSQTFDDYATAEAFLRGRNEAGPIVIKADGLAAGKGVVVAANLAEALQATRDRMSGAAFGDAGRRVVIEEFIDGDETSFMALVDGADLLPLATSQDHKRIFDGDRGPNTGGMGAYSPAPWVTPAVQQRIIREIMEPTVRGMAAEGHPFQGFLYAGVFVLRDGSVKIFEFNCRLGDPETQVILPRLQSDLVELCDAALDGRLREQTLQWDERTAVGVVMAAEGYPERPRTGDRIEGLDAVPEGVKAFHAGTRFQAGNTMTSGGRVLCVTALADDLRSAQQLTYGAVEKLRWPGAQYRRDIGARADGSR